LPPWHGPKGRLSCAVKASRARARAPERVSELARHVARSRHGNRRRVVAITGRAPGLSGRTVDDSQTHRWRKQDSNSWSPQQTTLSRSSSFPNPAFLFRPETATRSQEGPAVRIPFAPAKSQLRTYFRRYGRCDSTARAPVLTGSWRGLLCTPEAVVAPHHGRPPSRGSSTCGSRFSSR
jgi:hypothetical protein